MNEGSYRYTEIEKRWRQHWLSQKTFATASQSDKPKCYVLDMFPYPSGSGLHIGHPKGYIASDIYSRFKRLQGFEVLHPMGFDSFGLPAEQYAVEHNVHPATVTEQNIDNIRQQFQFLGLSYDWDREIATSRVDYYRWTQWIFVQLFNSYYDEDYCWQDAAGTAIQGKARPIEQLQAAFKSGQRSLSAEDCEAAGAGEGSTWQDLDAAGQQRVLNAYRLAYQKEVTVNWCPGLGTVLANEEVTSEGRSERGDFPVYQRPLKQWIMRITAYADRLLADLDAPALPCGDGQTFALDWPEPVKTMQRNWIGYSKGARVFFEVLAGGQDVEPLEVFTTRPDTLFGATFMVVAPQHPLLVTDGIVPEPWPQEIDPRWKGGPVEKATIPQTLAAYREAAEIVAGDRQERDKTGVFTGLYARNPVNGDRVPIFAADYVSMEYGTGAIMAVPAHDERDHAFAARFGLPIVQVVQAPPGQEGDGCFAGEGTSINSPVSGEGDFAITGLASPAAKERIIAALEAAGLGQATVQYRLRDWIFSRQRYWGEPFPLAHGPDGQAYAVEPPVALPPMEDFRPDTSDDPDRPVSPPLSRADRQWTHIEIDGQACQRELNVMPQWAGSCWYYLRFIDPRNEAAFCDSDQERHFMPVDLYIGGAEHAVLHLLYSRFWHKALYDLGHVSTPEPFKKLFNQGMITADAFTDERGTYIDIRQVELRDGEPYDRETGQKLQRFAGKMGKRYKNGLPPEEVGAEYGVDTLRLYEMYMGPLEASAPWSMEGIRGMQRFLQRVWRNFVDTDGQLTVVPDASEALLKKLHQTIAKVSDDIEQLRFNTAIAALIELNNALVGLDGVPKEVARDFLRLLNPFAPHLSEELWSMCGFDGEIAAQQWPQVDASRLAEDTQTLPVQINGKTRDRVTVAKGLDEEALRQQVLSQPNVQRHVPDPAAIRRFIVVPDRIINIVV